MTLERLWAGWRSRYVSEEAGKLETCFLCALAALPDDEVVSERTLVLERTATTLTVMNLYPYGSGHLLIAPRRHEAELGGLDEHEAQDLMAAQRRAVRAIGDAYGSDGINLGANLGRGRRGRGPPRPSPLPHAPALERRHQLHDRDRGDARAARGARYRLGQAPQGVAGGLTARSPNQDRRAGGGSVERAMATDDGGAAETQHAGDALPDDLRVESAYMGPYQFPDVRRRRLAALLYISSRHS